MSAPVTPQYLLEGAVYALEQCGLLLRDANILFRSGSYANVVVLAAFAREELGRSSILFNLRREVIDGKNFTIEQVQDRCEDHETKQKAGMLSTIITGSRRIGELLQEYLQSPQSAEWQNAHAELEKIRKIVTAQVALQNGRCGSVRAGFFFKTRTKATAGPKIFTYLGTKSGYLGSYERLKKSAFRASDTKGACLRFMLNQYPKFDGTDLQIRLLPSHTNSYSTLSMTTRGGIISAISLRMIRF